MARHQQRMMRALPALGAFGPPGLVVWFQAKMSQCSHTLAAPQSAAGTARR
jgi:hypothetical protein